MSRVKIHEVGPRDGLQNQPVQLSVEARVAFIERLVASGLRDVEVGAMVHPKWIPQMQHSDEVYRRLNKSNGVRYWVLIPNLVGYRRANDAEMRHLCVVVSSSETHNKKNLNCNIEDSLADIREICTLASSEDQRVRGYLSMVFGCPFEGDISFDQVVRLSGQLLEMGITEVALGDTVGIAHPLQVLGLCERLRQEFGTLDRFAIHLHDTNQLAVTNAFAAYQGGIRTFDGSAGGLGGCPYAGKGAKGNVRTESLLGLFDAMGVSTGVDRELFISLTQWMGTEQGLVLPYR